MEVEGEKDIRGSNLSKPNRRSGAGNSKPELIREHERGRE